MAGKSLALNVGTNQYTCPAYSAKKCFIATAARGDITTTVNRGRRAGPISSLLLLYVYGNNAIKLVFAITDITRSKLKLVYEPLNVQESSTHCRLVQVCCDSMISAHSSTRKSCIILLVTNAFYNIGSVLVSMFRNVPT